MKLGYRSLLTAAFTLTALVAWAATKESPTVQANSVDTLTRAAACTVSAYHVSAGDDATMIVANDGGWCWADIYERRNWRTLSANSLAVTVTSRHGHVLVGDIENQEVRVAYQPEPGFAGRDSFTLHYGTDDSERTFLVSVSAQKLAVRPGHGL